LLKARIRAVSKHEEEFQLGTYTEVLPENCEACVHTDCDETYICVYMTS